VIIKVSGLEKDVVAKECRILYNELYSLYGIPCKVMMWGGLGMWLGWVTRGCISNFTVEICWKMFGSLRGARRDNTKVDFGEIAFDSRRWMEELHCVWWQVLILMAKNLRVLCCLN
jgi:hypothetical protein